MNRILRHPHWLIAGILSISILLATSSPAEAERGEQERRGRNVPEVPIAALLPAASGIVGGGYYLIARFRRGRRSDDADSSPTDR